LIASEDDQASASLLPALAQGFHVLRVTARGSALEPPVTEPVDAILLELSRPEAAPALVIALGSAYPHIPLVIRSDGLSPELVRELGRAARLFLCLPRSTPVEELKVVLQAAASRSGRAGQSPPEGGPDRWTFEVAQRVALQREPEESARTLAHAAVERLGADHARCLLLWPASFVEEAPGAEASPSWFEARVPRGAARRADSGLTGHVARTRMPVRLVRAAEDGRYVPEVDDPQGSGDERLWIEPLRAEAGRVVAVLVLAWKRGSPEVSTEQGAELEALITCCTPLLAQAVERGATKRALAEAALGPRKQASGPFRREAVERLALGTGSRGDVLRISSSVREHTGWFFFAVVAAAVAFLLAAPVGQYASAPALVRVEGRVDLRAPASGAVEEIAVRPGARVDEGQLLVRLHAGEAAAEIERIDTELKLQLIRLLREPSDAGARGALTRLRAQRQLASVRLEERSVRAPRAGTISELRVEPGQHLTAGEAVAWLTPEAPEFSVIALMPGTMRPLLHSGMPARLEVAGFSRASRVLLLEEVGNEVIGPSEARRYLGAEIEDAMMLSGPMIIVRGRLPSRTFVQDGWELELHDGMVGTLETRVRTESLLLTLLPGLKTLLSEEG
jgi:hypothetical protein